MQVDGTDDRWAIEIPKIINIFIAGTVAKNISYFLESEYNTMDAVDGETFLKFERAFMQFSNIGGAQGVVNVKVGRFDPSSLFAFPTHRQQLNPILPIADTSTYPPAIQRIPLLPYAFSSKMFGLSNGSVAAGTAASSAGFSLLPFAPTMYNAPVQTGMSVHGRPLGDNSMFLYQLGFALNDKADGSYEQSTDVYAMLRLDFQVVGSDTQVSGFWYNAPDAARATLVKPNGSSDVVYAESATDIVRLGIGARMQWETIDTYFAYTQDSIDSPVFTGGAASSEWKDTGTGISVEADWRFHANWMLGVRYDQMNPGGLKRLPAAATSTGSVNDEINASVQMISPIIKYYPSPNIALYTRAHINLTSSSTLPDTANGSGGYKVPGFEGQEHPASNLNNIVSFGVDMAF